MGDVGVSLAKLLIVTGAVLMVTGLVLLYGDRIPGVKLWGRLPGDLRFESQNVHVYFPLATSLLVSAILSLILHLFRR